MIENRHGLVVDTELVQCSGTAERDAALLMAGCMRGVGRATVAGDKGYDTRDFVSLLRDMQVRIPGQSEETKTDRRSLRLAEDRRDAAQDQTPGTG